MNSLRPRLILIVGLALASIGQGLLRLNARHKEVDQQLRSTAIYATHSEQAIFTDAKQLLQRLANGRELETSPAQCQQLLQDALLSAPLYFNIAYIGPDGKTKCSAPAGQTATNYAQFSWWKPMTVRRGFVVGNEYHHHLSGRNVLPVALPLYDHRGAFTGALRLAIDMQRLSQRMASNRLPENAVVLLLDHAGTVLAANKPVASELAKSVAALGRENFDGTFITRTPEAGKWRWAAQPIGQDDKLVAFGMPESWLLGITPLYVFGDILLPLLMILFAWAAIWLGTEWLVIRWTMYLKTVSGAYGRGDFAVSTGELEMAPNEFRLLGQEMKKMARSIEARDLKLSLALQQEKSLAREIHHRVKNNLQIVSSLISLFGGKIIAPDARLAFQQITARVDALSLVHRLIEKSGPLPTVSMKTLFSELAEQIQTSSEADGKKTVISADICDCQVPMDMATPIALFAVEALTLGLYGMEGSMPPVKLSLQPEGDDQLLLTVYNEFLGDVSLSERTPSPMRVLAALAEQLGGRTWIDEAPDGARRLFLRFAHPGRTDEGSLTDEELGWGDGESTLTGHVYGAHAS
ncbi:MAG: sensor histidine kinase [Rhizomicrobium sp.]|nr:sensor histidine kinase [Rhizomicrobium sp.]